MAITILKNSSNQVWKDLSGNVIKDRLFNEQLLTNGLIGEFDAEHVNNINGYCQAMINQVSGGLNYYQDNVGYQYQILQDSKFNSRPYLNATIAQGLNRMNIDLITPFSQVFVVGYYEDLSSSYGHLGINIGSNGDGNVGNCIGVMNALTGSFNPWGGTQSYPCYINNKIYTTGQDYNKKPFIVSDYYDSSRGYYYTLMYKYLSTLLTGSPLSCKGTIAAVSFYNRKLSQDEITHNMRAYGQRYNIAMEA